MEVCRFIIPPRLLIAFIRVEAPVPPALIGKILLVPNCVTLRFFISVPFPMSVLPLSVPLILTSTGIPLEIKLEAVVFGLLII